MTLRLLLLVSAVVLVACGADEEAVRPAAVDAALAPRTLGSDLALFENDDEETASAFANAGENTLVADGRLWEIRRKDRLVGTLQITTVLPDVDLTEQRQRDAITSQVLSGGIIRLRVATTEILATTNQERAVFLWFGTDSYQVMQLKDPELADDYHAIVGQVVRHQTSQSSWNPLPPSAEQASAPSPPLRAADPSEESA